jgi:hypothetical protein
MNRSELYKQGYFFIRKRIRKLSHKQQCFGAGEFGIFISRKFGSWKLIQWFEREEECDRDIEDFISNYEKVILE